MFSYLFSILFVVLSSLVVAYTQRTAQRYIVVHEAMAPLLTKKQKPGHTSMRAFFILKMTSPAEMNERLRRDK